MDFLRYRQLTHDYTPSMKEYIVIIELNKFAGHARENNDFPDKQYSGKNLEKCTITLSHY